MHSLSPLSRLRGGREDGVIATHMAITIAFALFAVTQLTRTTVAAQEIDMRVVDIVSSVDNIDEETKTVAVLDETTRITTDILNTAKPLEAQTKQITEVALQIDANAKEILDSANSINGSVLGIAGSVGTIGESVRAINSTAKEINGSARSILNTFQALAPVVNSINGRPGNGPVGSGVHGINQRADVVIALSQGIKGDTGNIIRNVLLIDKHAKNICNSAAVSGGC